MRGLMLRMPAWHSRDNAFYGFHRTTPVTSLSGPCPMRLLARMPASPHSASRRFERFCVSAHREAVEWPMIGYVITADQAICGHLGPLDAS